MAQGAANALEKFRGTVAVSCRRQSGRWLAAFDVSSGAKAAYYKGADDVAPQRGYRTGIDPDWVYGYDARTWSFRIARLMAEPHDGYAPDPGFDAFPDVMSSRPPTARKTS